MATTTDALTSAPVYQTGLLANAPDNLDAKISSEIHALEHESSSLDNYGVLRPTEEERTALRRVSGSIPWAAYMICVIEFAERASYYGVQFVFSNFVQFPLPYVFFSFTDWKLLTDAIVREGTERVLHLKALNKHQVLWEKVSPSHLRLVFYSSS